jgi:16S rRNA (uracil1498-N3)-methyltransferase
MPYFFAEQNLSTGLVAEIRNEEARHILLSHRVKKGEKIKLQGPDGKRFLGEVSEIKKNSVKLKILEGLLMSKEPESAIVLFQSVIAEKALDFVFRKSTELGAVKIVLFNSEYTAVKLSGEQFKKKQTRWNKILKEAAKQSERASWPVLEYAENFDAIIKTARSLGKVFLMDIGGKKIQNPSPVAQALALIVGPEGGFSEGELAKLRTLKNLETVAVGTNVLRAETAALAGVAIIRHQIQ